MKIEDLILLLNNRLRDFKLSKDYAKMSGDLERMNTADKEIIALGDTLYQLNLLVDASKSATVKETLAEIITDGSVAVLGEYDITSYATDPLHEEKIMSILSKMAVMDTVEKIDEYIKSKYLSSPVTGEMIMSAALAYTVDVRLMMAIMEQDSSLGTAGVAVNTLNPGNVGNNDDGDTVTYESWQEGVTAVAEWLNRHRVSKGILADLMAPTASSTPSVATSTLPISTTTPAISTDTASSTPPSASVSTTTSSTTSTSTPNISSDTNPTATTTVSSTQSSASTTTPTASSTPSVATSTPQTSSTTTLPVASSTTPIIPATSTSTPNISSDTGPTATTTSPTPSVDTSTTPTSTTTPNTASPTSSIVMPPTFFPTSTSTTTNEIISLKPSKNAKKVSG